IVFSVNTQVVVAPLSMEEIIDYVDTGEAYDKAGAYAIQGGFGIYIKEIHGDYYNVVGFPIAKIYEKLLELGINIKK
ncbi:MAG: Maf family protein, partial [Bacillota bacterium]|nr:Maf family protein [Bacillota bacterium]